MLHQTYECHHCALSEQGEDDTDTQFFLLGTRSLTSRPSYLLATLPGGTTFPSALDESSKNQGGKGTLKIELLYSDRPVGKFPVCQPFLT